MGPPNDVHRKAEALNLGTKNFGGKLGGDRSFRLT
jgi:hypothetical protein